MRVLSAFLSVVPILSFGEAQEEDKKHRVLQKERGVVKDGKIDYKDEEATRAAKMQSYKGPAGQDLLRITSKVFIPPRGWRFLSFDGTHVDIQNEVQAFDVLRRPDSPDEIGIQAGFAKPITAAQFPLRGEGNLEPPRGKAGEKKWHWSAKVGDCDYFAVRVEGRDSKYKVQTPDTTVRVDVDCPITDAKGNPNRGRDLDEAIKKVFGPSEAGEHRGEMKKPEGDKKELESTGRLECPKCKTPGVMTRIILGIDFDPLSLESTIKMPNWKQYGQAGPKTKAAWDALIKALQTHEDGHRKIYNESYRTPAKAAIEGLANTQVVVEAHLWPEDTLEKLRKAGDEKLDGLLEELNKKLDGLWKTYEDADKNYDKTTNHGRNQAAYPGYGPGDNIPVGEDPRPLGD